MAKHARAGEAHEVPAPSDPSLVLLVKAPTKGEANQIRKLAGRQHSQSLLLNQAQRIADAAGYGEFMEGIRTRLADIEAGLADAPAEARGPIAAKMLMANYSALDYEPDQPVPEDWQETADAAVQVIADLYSAMMVLEDTDHMLSKALRKMREENESYFPNYCRAAARFCLAGWKAKTGKPPVEFAVNGDGRVADEVFEHLAEDDLTAIGLKVIALSAPTEAEAKNSDSPSATSPAPESSADGGSSNTAPTTH